MPHHLSSNLSVACNAWVLFVCFSPSLPTCFKGHTPRSGEGAACGLRIGCGPLASHVCSCSKCLGVRQSQVTKPWWEGLHSVLDVNMGFLAQTLVNSLCVGGGWAIHWKSPGGAC